MQTSHLVDQQLLVFFQGGLPGVSVGIGGNHGGDAPALASHTPYNRDFRLVNTLPPREKTHNNKTPLVFLLWGPGSSSKLSLDAALPENSRPDPGPVKECGFEYIEFGPAPAGPKSMYSKPRSRECSRCGRFSAPFPGGPGGRMEDLSKVHLGNLEKSVWASGWGVY